MKKIACRHSRFNAAREDTCLSLWKMRQIYNDSRQHKTVHAISGSCNSLLITLILNTFSGQKIRNGLIMTEYMIVFFLIRNTLGHARDCRNVERSLIHLSWSFEQSGMQRQVRSLNFTWFQENLFSCMRKHLRRAHWLWDKITVHYATDGMWLIHDHAWARTAKMLLRSSASYPTQEESGNPSKKDWVPQCDGILEMSCFSASIGNPKNQFRSVARRIGVFVLFCHPKLSRKWLCPIVATLGHTKL